MQSFAALPVTALLKRWPLVVGLGVVMVVVGVLLVANPFEAVRVLAVIFAVGLVISGIDEWVQAERHDAGWPAKVLAGIWIATGIAVVVWPGLTVWTLAVLVAIGLLAGGAAQLAFALRFRRELPMWGIWVIEGVISLTAGVLALAWPRATVVVLAVLLGLWVILRGLAAIVFGFALRSLNATNEQIYT